MVMLMQGRSAALGQGGRRLRLLHAEANWKAWGISSRSRRASRRTSGRRAALLVVEDAAVLRGAREPREDGVSNTDRVDGN